MNDNPVAEDDAELCRRAARGEPEALSRLLSTHQAGLWPLCLRGSGGNLLESEDFLQETFLRAIRGIATFDPARPFGAWLAGIAMRVIAERYRPASNRRERAADEGAEPPARQPDPECGDELARSMASVEPVTRAILLLRYVEDLGWDEIGTLVGLSREAVKKRLARGRADLRARLDGGVK